MPQRAKSFVEIAGVGLIPVKITGERFSMALS